MTVSTTTSAVTYIGNGSTTAFSFPFIGVSGADLEVIVTDPTGLQTTLATYLYTVTINTPPVGGLWGIGGSVTYPLAGSPLAVGYEITINRIVPYEQLTSIDNQGAFYPKAVEQGLDLIEMQLQQLGTDVEYSLKAPITDPSPPQDLPPAFLRENQVLGFDATGLIPTMYPLGSAVVTPPPVFTSVNISVSNSPYTITGNVNVVFIDASGGSVLVNLPAASTAKGVYVARLDNTVVNTVTIEPAGTNTISGAANYLLQFQHQGATFISNGISKWEAFGYAKPIVNPRTPGYISVTNIFDVINDMPTILNIQARGGPFYLDSYINAAIAIGGAIFFPPGDYHINNTINMLPGVEFWGSGVGQTTIFLGGTGAGTWGLQQSNPNGIESIEAYKLRDITFQVTSNGVRWNRIDGGFTNDNTSQQYMLRSRAIRCNFNMDNSTRYIGLQMNKCFDFEVSGCAFDNFLNSADFEGSDIGLVSNSRFDNETDYSILANSHATFGSSLAIRDSDFNNPALGFVNTSYLDILIDNNHMEIDGTPTRTTLINVHDNAFITKITNNRIEPNGFCTNWLEVTNDLNRYLVSAFNNQNPSSPDTMGAVLWAGGGNQFYFNNSGGRCAINWSNNSGSVTGWPMNTNEDNSPVPFGTVAYVTSGRRGVNEGVGIGQGLMCRSGLFHLLADANTGHYMEVSDWSGYPANTLKGTMTVTTTITGDVAGQTASWQVLDNGSSVATGTIVCTVANQFYKTAIVTSHAFSGPPEIRIWNADTSNGGGIYVQSVALSVG